MKMSSSNPRLAILGIICATLMARDVHAQTFNATFDFNSVTTSSGTTDPTTPPTATGVTFGSFSAVGYTGNPNASARFSWQSNPTGGINGDDNFANFTGSLDTGRYYEVTLTPQPSYSLNVDGITFQILRSSTGIRNYAVRGSLDSYAANLPASISPANANLGVGSVNDFRWLFDATTTAQNGSLVTLDSSFDALTAPVTFRFYGWNAEGGSGTFSIDNVVVSGSTAAVPEPGALGLFAFAMAGFGLVRRRRRARV